MKGNAKVLDYLKPDKKLWLCRTSYGEWELLKETNQDFMRPMPLTFRTAKEGKDTIGGKWNRRGGGGTGVPIYWIRLPEKLES